MACAAALPAGDEKLFSELNAYNPLPSPDGTVVAFLETETGWDRYPRNGGMGRSNLKSLLAFATGDGKPLKHERVDSFLDRWIDNTTLGLYRDWRFGTATVEGWKLRGSMKLDLDRLGMDAERVAYLSTRNTFVWLEEGDRTTHLQTPTGIVADLGQRLVSGALIAASPDENYLAIAGNHDELWVYGLYTNSLVHLGHIEIHPDGNWGYNQPSWDPWFRDSSRLVFSTGNSLMVASPDGTDKERVGGMVDAWLPVPSPDGKSIAYMTFTPRPMSARPDLLFWGESGVWVIKTGERESVRVTKPSGDTTDVLRWLNDTTLIFDRISDEAMYKHARIWTAQVPSR
jgi:hypothetical protein